MFKFTVSSIWILHPIWTWKTESSNSAWQHSICDRQKAGIHTQQCRTELMTAAHRVMLVQIETDSSLKEHCTHERLTHRPILSAHNKELTD